MRHLKKGKKFGRLIGDRRSFLRNLSNNLIRRGKIETTEARAKAIKPAVEKLITLAKKQNLSSRRLLLSKTHDPKITKKLYEELAPRYLSRPGGYLRIIKLSKARKRDGTILTTIEFV